MPYNEKGHWYRDENGDMQWQDDDNTPGFIHPDDLAVDRVGAAMKLKLAQKRTEGRGGWDTDECSQEFLSKLLREHVEKGDPIDVLNFAMMLHQRGETILPVATPAKGLREAAQAAVYGVLAHHAEGEYEGLTVPLSAWDQATHNIVQAVSKALASTAPAPLSGRDGSLREALKHARQFISNGIELGFIRMPDKSTPDPAHGTLDMIDAALAAVSPKDESK